MKTAISEVTGTARLLGIDMDKFQLYFGKKNEKTTVKIESNIEEENIENVHDTIVTETAFKETVKKPVTESVRAVETENKVEDDMKSAFQSVSKGIMIESNDRNVKPKKNKGDTKLTVDETPHRQNGKHHSKVFKKCQLCEERFPGPSRMTEHMVDSHFATEVRERFIHLVSENICNLCGKDIKSSFLHIGATHGKVDEILVEKGLRPVSGIDMDMVQPYFSKRNEETVVKESSGEKRDMLDMETDEVISRKGIKVSDSEESVTATVRDTDEEDKQNSEDNSVPKGQNTDLVKNTKQKFRKVSRKSKLKEFPSRKKSQVQMEKDWNLSSHQIEPRNCSEKSLISNGDSTKDNISETKQNNYNFNEQNLAQNNKCCLCDYVTVTMGKLRHHIIRTHLYKDLKASLESSIGEDNACTRCPSHSPDYTLQ